MQRRFEAFGGREVEVDEVMRDVVRRHRQQLPQLALRQHRRVQVHVLHVVGGLDEGVAFAPELRRQRHHAVLAQGIDRRVRHLRERLAEAVVQRPYLLRQRRHRHVVAHRADGFLLGLGQRPQHVLALLARELEQFLKARQCVALERRISEVGIDELAVQVGHALLEPALVRRAAAVDGIDRVAVEQFAAGEVGGDHLARAELALGLDLVDRDVEHAGLRGDHEAAIARAQPACRAQAVAVERAGGIAAIEHDDAGRPVPGLNVERVVLVERGEIGILVLERLRRRRHQHAHRLEQVHAGGLQQFQHRIETLRIGTIAVDDRIELARIEPFVAPDMRARLGPGAVAGDGVDLAVVREQPERLRERPARAGVGREALVEHDRATGEVGAAQIRIQLRQVLG